MRGVPVLIRLIAVAGVTLVIAGLPWGTRGGRAAVAGMDVTPRRTETAIALGQDAVQGLRFVPVDSPFFTGVEPSTWFDAPQLPRTEWRLYRVQGDGEPALLYQTFRYILGVAWTADGRTVLAPFTYGYGPGPGVATPGVTGRDGVRRFDLDGARVTATELALDGASVRPSPSGARVLAQLARPGSGTEELVVADRSGAAWRLEGAQGPIFFTSWSPDESAVLLLLDRITDAFGGVLLFVPLSGASATQIATGVGFGDPVAWSPDGASLAYTVNRDLYVFDRTTGTSRWVASGRTGAAAPLTWTADGRGVLLGGELINAASGVTLGAIRPERGVATAAISPDHRYLAVAERPSDRPSPSCEGGLLASAIYLYDLETGRLWRPRACGAGYAELRWLADSRHLLITDVADGHGIGSMVTLLDVETDEAVPLSEGIEQRARPYPSPDGAMVLVGGPSLRLYDAGGRLLREIPVRDDAGLVAVGVAWAPDGSGFVYVVGPGGRLG
jgi:Tol biopolymer transport system component